MTSAPIDKSAYEKRNDLHSACIVMLHFSFALLPLGIAAWLGLGWHTCLLFVWYGIGLNSVLNLMHECAHFHIFKSQRACEVLGRWILGGLTLSNFDSYRERHWMHHRYLGTDDDTKYIYRTNITHGKMAVLLLGCLLLIEASKRFGTSFTTQNSSLRNTRLPWFLRPILFHTVLFSLVILIRYFSEPASFLSVVVHAAIIYFIFVIYAMASVTVFLAALRGIAEHQIDTDEDEVVGHAALRNFSASIFGRWFFGAYGFAEHKTHHHFSKIPYYKLSVATERLAESDASFEPQGSYISKIVKLMNKRVAE